MKFGQINTAECVNTVPPPDARCSDPSFAEANPDICGVQSLLKIKPGVGMACELGSIQFKAFISTNGREEDVTADTIWSSSNMNVAVIGAHSGNATGLTPGDVTITATYGEKIAHASLSVLVTEGGSCCRSQHVAMMLLVDTSKSMSLAFGAGYASRLVYAKAAATRFISEVNDQKDFVGLETFNDATVTTLSTPSNDIAAVGALVPPIQQTQQLTSFYNALNAAITTLDASGADREVIVLISDGEDTTAAYTDATNPILLLSDFKNRGGIVICLGIRASGDGFTFLNALSTGGFFINAYPAVADTALDFFSGLKGYICAGNCTPSGDIMVPSGSFDFSGFTNWTVTEGSVDLLGEGFIDPVPGHGLYVNLSGSSAPHRGLMTTTNSFPIISGHIYRVRIQLSSNQWTQGDDWPVFLKVYSAGGTILEQTVLVPGFGLGFNDYNFSFTAGSDDMVFISVQMGPPPGGVDIAAPQWGILFNEIELRDLTASQLIFLDNFDTENVQYIPPACGVGTYYHYLPDFGYTGYDVGTNCYGHGCLNEPPPAQLPDPSPLSDIERGFHPPRIYTSTQTACAECPEGQANYLRANLIPAMTGVTTNGYTVEQVPPNTADDVGFESWHAFTGAGYWRNSGNASVVRIITPGMVSGRSIRITPGLGSYGHQYFLEVFREVPAPGIQPIVWQTIQFPVDGTPVEVWFSNQDENTGFYIVLSATGGVDIKQIELLDVTTPGPDNACATATATSETSQADADHAAQVDALAAAQADLVCIPVWTATEQYTAHCPFNQYGLSVTRSASYTSLISQEDAENHALALAFTDANNALDCTLSNNNAQIIINDRTGVDPAASTPYPAVEAFEGFDGDITSMAVFLKNFTHTSPCDVIALLMGPDGTTCLLMQRCGGVLPGSPNPVTNLTFEISDDGSPLPLTTLTSGKWAPTQYGAQLDFPSPVPPGPYGTSLSVFNGKSPNGSWSLWIIDINSGDAGFITDGFDIVFTTTTDPDVYGVGDIHVDDGQQLLAQNIAGLIPLPANGLRAFLMLGDVQNPNFTLAAWTRYWNWGFGPLASKTIFVPGNHDWLVQGAPEMTSTRDFWSGALVAVYGGNWPASVLVSDPVDFTYAVKIGTWKIVAFNSEAYQNDANTLNVGGTLYNRISTELSETGYHCILVSHRPRWSDDTTHGNQADLDAIWRLAVAKGAVALISGHAHIDEIQALRDAAGAAVPFGGLAQIIAGTGNVNLYGFIPGYTPVPKWKQDAVNAIFQLFLNESGMTVQFIAMSGAPIAGTRFAFPVNHLSLGGGNEKSFAPAYKFKDGDLYLRNTTTGLYHKFTLSGLSVTIELDGEPYGTPGKGGVPLNADYQFKDGFFWLLDDMDNLFHKITVQGVPTVLAVTIEGEPKGAPVSNPAAPAHYRFPAGGIPQLESDDTTLFHSLSVGGVPVQWQIEQIGVP